MTFLKERWKPLLAGVALGLLVGSAGAGYAIYKSQEAGRKALTEVTKVAAEMATCNASLKEITANANNSKELLEKSETEKLDFQKQLDEQKEIIEKLTTSLKKLPAKSAEKTTTPLTGTKPLKPNYSNTPAAMPASSRENWEEGL
jgi:peptidoglycan hydrolase CwlO-like protein